MMPNCLLYKFLKIIKKFNSLKYSHRKKTLGNQTLIVPWTPLSAHLIKLCLRWNNKIKETGMWIWGVKMILNAHHRWPIQVRMMEKVFITQPFLRWIKADNRLLDHALRWTMTLVQFSTPELNMDIIKLQVDKSTR